MNDGTTEARTAAHWWADQLRARGDIDLGDAKSEAFYASIRLQTEAPTPEQIEAFRAHLERSILAMLREPSREWDKAVADDPQRGERLRMIRVNYDPDAVLTDALAAAGLPRWTWGLGLLPMKTVMWVNPGSVSVSAGYGQPTENLELIDV